MEHGFAFRRTPAPFLGTGTRSPGVGTDTPHTSGELIFPLNPRTVHGRNWAATENGKRPAAPPSVLSALLAPPPALCGSATLACLSARSRAWFSLKLNLLSVVKTWSTTDAVAILARGRHPDVLHALSQDNFAMVCLVVLVY